MSAVTPLRGPRPGSSYVEVPAPRPVPWPRVDIPLEVIVTGAGQDMTLEGFLDITATTALVVVVDGVLVHERYLCDTTADDRLLGNSATKSALASLVGVAVTSGSLPDLDVAVDEYVPELTGGGYAGVTLRQVLTMTSGVRWTEDYFDPASPAARMLSRCRDGHGGLRDTVASVPAGRPPGSRFAYCSPDSLVVDWVRERASGQTFAEGLTDLWRVVGAEQPAVVGLDAPLQRGGVAMAAAAMCATARDWARLGLLQVDGCWRGQRVLDAGWVRDSSRASYSFTRPGRLPSRMTTHAGFGYHWWPMDESGDRVMADGMQGQFVYVDRPRRVVVAKMSAWPYDDSWQDRQLRDLCYLALPDIAEAAWRMA